MQHTPDIVFHGFLELLRKEGFSIHVDDYIEFIALFSQFSGDQAAFKYYVAPIVCRNSDEQALFYFLYDQYFSSLRQLVVGQMPVAVPGPERPADRIGKPLVRGSFRWFLKHFVFNFYAWFCFCFVAGIVVHVSLYTSKYGDFKAKAETAERPTVPVDSSDDAVASGGVTVFVAKPLPRKVEDSAEERSHVVATGAPIGQENTLHSTVFAWLLVLGLACLGSSMSFFPRRRTRILPAVDASLFEGDAAPFVIPLVERSEVIRQPPLLARSAQRLSQSLSSDVYKLSIGQTVLGAVRNFGFVEPVYAGVGKRPEYLVLIDRRSVLQCGLFLYLVRYLAGQHVSIYSYFFDDPVLFYSERLSAPLDFYGLRERHSGSQLIIMGDGYQFINRGEGRLEKGLVHSFAHWENRVMLTPVSMADWGGDERLLSGFFKLLPVDTQFDLTSTMLKKVHHYKHAGLRLDSRESLRNYARNEDLFQWICALAIYPTLRWEMVLAIGAAILGARDALDQLTFDNLLRIARIPWLGGHAIPYALRLSLLKWLSIDNEIVARKAILDLLREADGAVSVRSFVYEEMMIQGYTQSFVLFAHDVTGNAVYEQDAKIFMSLWDKGLIRDSVTVHYLTNAGGTWSTPVLPFDSQEKGGGVERFMQELLALRVIQNPFIRGLLRKVGMSFFLLLTLLFLFKDNVQGWGINRSLGIIDRDYPTSDIRVKVPVNDCLKKMLKGEWLELIVVNYDNNVYSNMLRVTGKDTLVFYFSGITMAGKDAAKPAFHFLLNGRLTVDNSSPVYYSGYLLQVQGIDCESRLPLILPAPAEKHSDDSRDL